MPTHRFADHVESALRVMAPVFEYFEVYEELAANQGVADFAFGNPHDMPLPGVVAAFQRGIVPQNKDWYAYKFSEPDSQEIVAETLRKQRAMPFESDDIIMTNGAFGAIAVALNTIVQQGDEAIFISPPWFFYEAMIMAAGGKPVRVRVDPDTFDLNLDAIADAITERTCAIIVNSPNNPTGKLYSPVTLQALADLLTRSGERHGRPIYLLSDESYHRILYDGRTYHSATAYYPFSLLLYTYGKTLLMPGQRAGYIALPPTMPDRQAMRDALFMMQLTTAYAFPNALLQHALPELEKMSIDVEHLQEKRDRMIGGLREIGYAVHEPEGTFYLMPRSPIDDDMHFTRILADRNILCLPGTVVEMPGYFRISLTANDEMIERALPGFAEVFAAANKA